MTPEQKAKEIIERLEFEGYCLFCVNQIIQSNPITRERIWKNNCSWVEEKSNIDYWLLVREKIKNNFKS